MGRVMSVLLLVAGPIAAWGLLGFIIWEAVQTLQP